MALRLNVNGLINEFLNIFERELESALDSWENEVKSKLKHPFYSNSNNAKVSHEIKREAKGLVAYLKANTYVLADSYGTGSNMLDINPGLAAYRNNKKLWNPERTGKAIVGRKEGPYTDLFGRPRKTSGAFKGVNIEGKRVSNNVNGNDYYISATHPSYAIQLAEQYLYKQWIPLAYKRAINNLNFAKFLIES